MATTTSTSARFAAPATNWSTRLTPKSLRVRLALLAALLLCLIQVALSAAFYAFTSGWLHGQVDQSLIASAAQITAALNDGEPLEAEDFEFRFDEGSPAMASLLRERQFFVRVLDRDSGETVSVSADYGLPVTGNARTTGGGFETLAPLDGGARFRVYTLPLDPYPAFVLQTGQSLRDVEQTQAHILRLLLLGLLATALLATLAGWLLADRALIPVNAITRTARDIGEHDLSRRIDMALPDDELGRLAQTFNTMLDRLEGSFQRQRRFTADAAHELRTPLSIMQTGLDVILSQPRTAAVYVGSLETMREEVQRLGQMTGQLLMLARADSNSLTLDRQPVDLSLMLATVAEQVALAAEQKNIAIRCDVPPRVTVSADEDRLIQVALNLMENAVKYTPDGGTVTVTLTRSDGYARFSIADTGIGIAPQHLPHVFDRFFRVDAARSRQHGGVGLGLAIAQHIAQLHGGHITVRSTLGVGSEFTVTLPAS